MREFIVTGFVLLQSGLRSFTHGMLLGPDEVMDMAKFREIEAQLAPHIRIDYGEPAQGFTLTGFQEMEHAQGPSEPKVEDSRIKQLNDLVGKVHALREALGAINPAWAIGDPLEQAITLALQQVAICNVQHMHLNDCGTVLPPVNSPLWIEVAPNILLRASRPAHVPQRKDLLLFDLAEGGMYIGRPRWTHR